MPNYYDRGDVVRVSSVFTTTAGVATNPTNVKFVFTAPNGLDTINSRAGATTGTVDSITRTGAGAYYRDITIGTSSGAYHYRFSSTGNITTAEEGTFRVRHRYTTT